jgi:hypothetical protein
MTPASPAWNKYLRGSRSKSNGSSGAQSARNKRENAQIQMMITAAKAVSKTKNTADHSVLRISDRTNDQKGSDGGTGLGAFTMDAGYVIRAYQEIGFNRFRALAA